MTFPRSSGVLLAVAGGWSVLFLVPPGIGLLRLSAGAGLFWALTWAPGFIAWYGYLRRAMGHFLFGRALITWLTSMIANIWSFCVLYSSWLSKTGGEVPLIVDVAVVWIACALLLSVVCIFLEGRCREPKPGARTGSKASDTEFSRLLDEHHSGSA